MNLRIKEAILFTALLAVSSKAFTFKPLRTAVLPTKQTSWIRSSSRLYVTDDEKDTEIERLKSMAAKLRAEASQLEAEKQQQLAEAASRAFKKFDTDQDGKISFEELKAGLEKEFKTTLPESRVKKLMEDFDASGDGVLQKDEFVTMDRFRTKLDALAREEKAQALEKTKQAQKEEELAKFLQAQLDVLNDGPPSASDKILSTLPYLFPLLDGFQFARFLVLQNPDNPISATIAILYALYRSIPLGGFIAFFALSFLSGNPRINRLIRFNMQQAIYLDIALFFPSLLAGLYSLVASGSFQLPRAVTELGTDAIFFALVAALGYSVVSSLLGITPNKIPFISDAVDARLPTVDMFDKEGRFQPKNPRTKDDDDENKRD